MSNDPGSELIAQTNTALLAMGYDRRESDDVVGSMAVGAIVTLHAFARKALSIVRD